jgi:hypothetical protein
MKPRQLIPQSAALGLLFERVLVLFAGLADRDVTEIAFFDFQPFRDLLVQGS